MIQQPLPPPFEANYSTFLILMFDTLFDIIFSIDYNAQSDKHMDFCNTYALITNSSVVYSIDKSFQNNVLSGQGSSSGSTKERISSQMKKPSLVLLSTTSPSQFQSDYNVHRTRIESNSIDSCMEERERGMDGLQIGGEGSTQATQHGRLSCLLKKGRHWDP